MNKPCCFLIGYVVIQKASFCVLMKPGIRTKDDTLHPLIIAFVENVLQNTVRILSCSKKVIKDQPRSAPASLASHDVNYKEDPRSLFF